MHRALESGRYDFIEGTVENPIINMSVIQIKLVVSFFSQLFVPMNGNKILYSYVSHIIVTWL